MRNGKSIASLFVTAALILALAAPASAGWFGSKGIKGSGERVTVQRDLDNFSRIRSSGSFDVTITIGEPQNITVTYDDNLVEYVLTEVDGQTLHIYSDESVSSRKSCDIQITVPSLTDVKVSGSGDFEITGLKGEIFEYEVSGSGDLDVSGEVEEVTIEISGSGDVDARDLRAKRAYVEISGSGDVSVWAEELFDGEIAGSGDIAYYGNPKKVSRHVAGSGDIRKR